MPATVSAPELPRRLRRRGLRRGGCASRFGSDLPRPAGSLHAGETAAVDLPVRCPGLEGPRARYESCPPPGLIGYRETVPAQA